MAEWLRRWTRNPLGSPRAGSNPADYDRMYIFIAFSRQLPHLIRNRSEKPECKSFLTNKKVSVNDHEDGSALRSHQHFQRYVLVHAGLFFIPPIEEISYH